MTKKEAFFCGLAILFALLFALKSVNIKDSNKNKTDTIYRVSERLKIDTLRIKSPPNLVTIWKKDTLLRNKIIIDTVIVSIREKRRKLEVDRIAPLGSVQTDFYKLPFWSKYEINAKGNVRIKKHTFLKILVAASAVGIITFTGFKLIK